MVGEFSISFYDTHGALGDLAEAVDQYFVGAKVKTFTDISQFKEDQGSDYVVLGPFFGLNTPRELIDVAFGENPEAEILVYYNPHLLDISYDPKRFEYITLNGNAKFVEYFEDKEEVLNGSTLIQILGVCNDGNADRLSEFLDLYDIILSTKRDEKK